MFALYLSDVTGRPARSLTCHGAKLQKKKQKQTKNRFWLADFPALGQSFLRETALASEIMFGRERGNERMFSINVLVSCE